MLALMNPLSPLSPSDRDRTAKLILAYLLAKMALSLIYSPTFAYVCCPPEGLGLSLLMAIDTNLWGLALGLTFATAVVADLLAHSIMSQIVGHAAYGCFAALLAALLVRELFKLGRPQDDVTKFRYYLFCAVFAAPLVSACLPALFVRMAVPGSTLAGAGWTFFAGTGLSQLTWGAFFLVWLVRRDETPRKLSPGRVAEGTVLAVLLAVSSRAACGSELLFLASHPMLLASPLPLMLWACTRFGLRGATAASLVTAVETMWYASRELGPFGRLGPANGVFDAQVVLLMGLTPLVLLATVLEERERAERMLHESQLQLSDTLRIGRMAHFEVDLRKRLVKLSDEWYDLLHTSAAAQGGYELPLEHVVGTFVVPRDRAEVQSALRDLLSVPTGGLPRRREMLLRCADGEERWYSHEARMEIDVEGRIAKVHGATQDITDLKRAELAVREREQFFSAVFENIPLMIFVKEAEQLRFVRFNKAGQDLIGVPGEELIGRNDHDFFPPEQADFFVREDRKVLESRALADIPEEPIQTRHRGLRFLHTRKIPILGERCEPLYLLGISEDITERKLADEALRQAKEAADAASRAKSLFLANMSHEIRTPMNAVLGFTQAMLNDPSLGDEQRRHLDLIMSSGEHLLALINDVLEMSKIEAGRLALSIAPFDLHQMLSGIEAMFRLRTEKKGLRLDVRRTDRVPRFIVSDEGKLRQVAINLLGNAVKFTSTGGIVVRVDASPREPDSQSLHVEVEDTGVGISPSDMELLFRPFAQTEGGKQAGGTGLGLAISREYINLMGGDLSAVPREGDGCVFKFSVPMRIAPNHQADARATQRALTLPANQPEVRVLVVDDQAVNRELLRALLRPLGVTVREAESGEESIDVFRDWRPHMVLMDLRMHGMDGLEATRILKAEPDGARTPIVAVTAGAYADEQKAAAQAGADGFLRKPFKRDDIIELLAHHLDLKFVDARPESRLVSRE